MERDCYAQELISSRVIGVGEPSLDDNEAGIEADQWGNSTVEFGSSYLLEAELLRYV